MANHSKNDERHGRLSDDDVARLSGQVAALTSARLPLAPGLRASAEEMPRGRLRSTIEAVAAGLDRGASVDEAIASQGARLPGHVRGLVLAGSRTGRVGDVLGKFVAFTEVGAELRRGLWVNMAYPALTLAIAIAVFSYICTYLVPSFESIFRDFGIALPLMTEVLLRIALLFNLSGAAAVELLVGVCALGLFLSLGLKDADRRALLGGLPVTGGVWRNTALAEFCHLLALLLESDVPLGEALRLAGEGVRESSLARAGAGLARDVEGGLSLAQALGRWRVFPKGLTRVLRWAEGHQTLPESLHTAGQLFEARARAQARLAGTIFAVFAVVTILAVIGMVVGGLLLPMFQLISRLSG